MKVLTTINFFSKNIQQLGKIQHQMHQIKIFKHIIVRELVLIKSKQLGDGNNKLLLHNKNLLLLTVV